MLNVLIESFIIMLSVVILSVVMLKVVETFSLI
jgi:hypothetical protein